MEVTTAAATDGSTPVAEKETIDLGANYDEIGPVASGRFLNWSAVLAVLLGGPALIALVAFGQRTWRKRRPAMQNQIRRRELIQTLDELPRSDHFHMELSSIVQDYLRVRFNLPAGELSGEDLRVGLRGRSDAEAEYTEIRALLDACDAGRFATGRIDQTERDRMIEQARHLLRRLERAA
jgi:hypothetical protein